MKKRIFRMLALVVVAAAGILGYFHYDSINRDFTPWMSPTEVSVFFKSFEPVRTGEPDYWKKGHWVTAVEGRWGDGVPQYRFRYGPVPVQPGHEWTWFWFLDMDQETFGKKLKEYAETGFTLVWYNSFKRPDGTRRYQGVWHKLTAQ